jgi:hypothetical protein
MSLIRFAPTVVALFVCAALVGQSATPPTRVQTFHVQGTIRAYADSVVPGVQVTFEGEKISKIVSADKGGFYEADLPVGLYTMTAQPLRQSLQEFRRPLFRVGSPTVLTLNVTLDPAGPICDPVMPPPGHPLPADDGVRMCGGWDSFPAPSEHDVPFELFIRYRTRRPVDRGYAYNTGEDLFGGETPVFVAYNLFTLHADHAVYDVHGRMLKATGNVVVESADGVTQHVGSMTFKIENGEATPLD